MHHTLSATTRLVGLLGWPVSHSLSPRMHNAAYAALGLDWAYVPLPVAPERVGEAVRGLAALGFAGANVTVPHKQAVIPFLDELTPISRAVGAVNTIVVRADGSLLGDTTDGAGFMADLWTHGVGVSESANLRICESANLRISEWADGRSSEAANQRRADGEEEGENRRVTVSPCRRVLLLGSGGAARGVAYALAEAGAELVIANRTFDKAQDLCQTIGAALPQASGRLRAARWPDDLPELAAWAGLVVNTTSLGLHEGDALPWRPGVAFRPGQVVYDLIYNRPTELLALARSQGAAAIDGLGMLVHQGALAAALWTGIDAGSFARLMRKELETQ